MKDIKQRFVYCWRLIQCMEEYRWKVVATTLATILHNLLDIVPDIFIGIVVDVVVNRQDSFLARLGIVDVWTQIALLASIVLLIAIFDAFFQYASQVSWMRIAQLVQHQLRVRAYAHMQQLEMRYFESKSPGELLTIVNDDVNQLEYFFDKVIVDGIYFWVNVIVICSVFFYLSPSIAIFAFFPTPIIVWIAYSFQHRLGKLYASVREKAGFLGARISMNVMGMATIKSYTAEEYELRRLSYDSKAYKQSSSDAVQVSAAFVPVIRLVVASAFVVTLLLGGWYTLHGVLAVGSYSVLVSMTHRLLWPFIYLGKITDMYKRSMASVERIFSIIDTPIGIVDGQYEIEVEQIKGKIEFKEVSFSYAAKTPVFCNLSLSIEPGQMVGFVGATGSGKTTLIKLLLRFYDPSHGTILLDDMATKDLKLPLLRRSFGVVSQDVFLFKGTIRENIAYGAVNSAYEDVEYAARVAEIHDFIMSLPNGYDTMIGEYGQKLSGGQKQRISIARALMNKPPILIFDEATSSVDNETEAAIQRSLAKIAKNHTIFIIAHRLSSVRNADTIFVLHNGAMVEAGKHEELLMHNGAYAKLWQVQMGQ